MNSTNNLVSDTDQFKLTIDLFDDILRVFESDMKSTPYNLLPVEYSLHSKEFKPEFLKEVKRLSVYVLNIYPSLSPILNSFSESKSNQDYLKLVDGIKNAFLEIEKKFQILNGIQDFFTKDVFYKLYTNHLRRYKHLFKHFFLGLKVFVPVETA